MNQNKILGDLTNQIYTDLVINLIDDENIIKMHVHKLVLGTCSEYFNTLFNFDNKNKSNFNIIVDNSQIAYDVILSLYDPDYINLKNYDLMYLLKYYKCRAFFCLENNYNLLDDIVISSNEINILLETFYQLNILDNNQIIKTIRKNMPIDYDFSLLTKEFIEQLIVFDSSKPILITSDYSEIMLWDLETGVCLNTLKAHNDWIRSVIITKDKRIISGSDDCTIKIWNSITGFCLNTLTSNSPIRISILTSDDKKIISGHLDYTIKIWDLETGSQLNTLYGHTSEIRSILITYNNEKIISASIDCTIRIWNLQNDSISSVLIGHKDWIKCIL